MTAASPGTTIPPGTTVAVIGTGRMGAAMVGRLLGAGFAVTVWNRTAARAAGLGAPVATTPREAVSGAAFVVVSLADDDAVRAAYEGPDGIIAGLGSPNPADADSGPAGLGPVGLGPVVCDTSTISPATVRSLAGAVGAAGATLLDTPVSGSVAAVQSGQLTILAGGPAAALDAARPVLGSFGSRVVHLGDSGAGATMKLVVNSVVHALNAAVAEALVLAEKAGLDRAAAYDVFAGSAVAAPFVQYKRESFLHPDEVPVAFALDLVAKDLRLVGDLAATVGARMPQRDVNANTVDEAVRAGLGDHDLSALAVLLRS